MSLSGLHILLTYRCLNSCDHCFVWGSPNQTGVFTLARLTKVLGQARAVRSIKWIFFEGGEPFLYYPLLLDGARAASHLGFHVGIVTNGYWATSVDDARAWLTPLSECVESLSISTDLLHGDQRISAEAESAQRAARELGLSADFITCDLPVTGVETEPRRGEPVEGGDIVYRGRAAVTLAPQAPSSLWTSFTECPHEDLASPGRLHLDPEGNLHLCQGLVLGNCYARPLAELLKRYRPRENPIVGPLLAGGPAELARRFGLPTSDRYADACHLCYSARQMLRPQFPEVLCPGQMYGEGLT
jgi:hypothetical protein